MSLWALFFLFVKFGLLCFGGGFMLIPLLTDAFVKSEPQIMTPTEFGNLISIAQATPGPIGINTATYVGFNQYGPVGAVCCTMALVLPALALVLLALKLLKKYENHWIVRGFLTGMRPASFGLILAAAMIFLQMSVLNRDIPWDNLIRLRPVENFYLRPAALAIMAATVFLMKKTSVSFLWIILGSALLGALIL